MKNKGGPKDNKGSQNIGGSPQGNQHESKKEIKPKDYSTAILDRKKAPHRLIAEDGVGPSEDASVIQLTQRKMDELKIFKSETVLLKGKKRKETICICLPDDTGRLTDDKIRMGKVVRNNLRIRLGDIVSVHKYQTIPVGNRVHILPFEDTIEGISGNLTQTYLMMLIGQFIKVILLFAEEVLNKLNLKLSKQTQKNAV